MNDSPVILILAAGRGERFRAAGGTTDKLDAPLTTSAGTRTVLEHVVAAAQASGLPWHVVRPPDTAQQMPQGMGTSIAAGVAARADAAGWLVLPGDLPLIQPQSIQAVARALRDHPAVLPMVCGQPGHPVGFSRACRSELLSLRGEQGARPVWQHHGAHLLVLDDVGCILDVDTPERLAYAQSLVAPPETADPARADASASG
ncbi:MAG: NTP transferase domain-containing protein [Limnohabitans sp.]